MRKVQLDRELENQSQEDRKQNPLDEVKLLLEGDRNKDLQIMRHLAGKSELIKEQDILGKQLDLERKNMEYGKTYTIDQIEKIARKYRLRFLNSTKFVGKVDIEAISKIKEFEKKHNVSCSDEVTLSKKFYILAPAESFNLRIETIKEAREREKEARRIARDPILFYKIDEDHYRLIHKWGSDFTILRRIQGFLWDNFKTYKKVMKSIAWMISLITLFICSKVFGPQIVVWEAWVTGISTALFGILFYKISIARVTNDSWKPREMLFNKRNWNSSEILKRR